MGVFEFIFGKGAPKDDTAPKQAFYLSDDDAKSFGDIEYMRTSKPVRRTFAKKKGETEHMESVKSISATTMTDLDGNASSASVSAPTTFGNTDFLGSSKPAASTTESSSSSTSAAPAASASSVTPSKRKPTGTSMDMFRNMAKDIRK